MSNNQKPSIPVLIEDLGMLHPKETSKYIKRFGLYQCACGNKFRAMTSDIKNGHTSSCGCYHKALVTIHGLRGHPIYSVWKGMVTRTTNPKAKDFINYGGRGIAICSEWLSVANFIEDMYPTYEEGLTIDRIDNDLGYNKFNCRWATKNVQQRNKRIIQINNTSGFRGVSFNKKRNKWLAQIMVDGKIKRLGYFHTALDGAYAYNEYIKANNLEHTKNIIDEV
jgi:hypothetical protein